MTIQRCYNLSMKKKVSACCILKLLLTSANSFPTKFLFQSSCTNEKIFIICCDIKQITINATFKDSRNSFKAHFLKKMLPHTF